jgi:hypothetical protein
MKNAVFWDVAPCRSCVNRRFGGKYRLYFQGRKIHEPGTSVSRWLQTEPPVENIQLYKDRKVGWLSLQPPTHAGSSLTEFSTLKMEAIRSSETSVHTRSTRRHNPEDGILHNIHSLQIIIRVMKPSRVRREGQQWARGDDKFKQNISQKKAGGNNFVDKL